MTRAGWIALGALTTLGGIWMTQPRRTDRQRVVDAALSEQAAHGDAPRTATYWRAAGLSPPYPRQWCGAFVHWALDEAGLHPHPWQIGSGFLYQSGLAPTRDPKPGDVGYIDQPFQHHVVVAAVDGDNVHTVEGNAPGIKLRTRQKGDPRIVWFSIAPLLSS